MMVKKRKNLNSFASIQKRNVKAFIFTDNSLTEFIYYPYKGHKEVGFDKTRVASLHTVSVN